MAARNRIVALLLAACASGGAWAQVNALPAAPHVLVYGEADARALPDRFSIDIRLEVVDPQPDAARQRVQAHFERILAALEPLALPNEIEASGLEIQPSERYDSETRRQVFEGTRVSRAISAVFDTQAKLERVLAGLDAPEEVQVSGIRTRLADERVLRGKLKAEAIAQARAKTAEIAASFGQRVAGLYSVSDVAPQFDYGVRPGRWPATFQYDAGSGRFAPVIFEDPTPVDLAESLRSGYVDYQERIYAGFLLGE